MESHSLDNGGFCFALCSVLVLLREEARLRVEVLRAERLRALRARLLLVLLLKRDCTGLTALTTAAAPGVTERTDTTGALGGALGCGVRGILHFAFPG